MAFLEMEPSSSPDPLSLCDENLPSPSPSRPKTRRSSITPRKPLVNVSGNAAIQDFYITTPTPTKGKSRSKGNTDGSSPWRIRLTVQADQMNPKGQQDASAAVSPRLQEHTVTTRIPLKGLETSSPLDSQRRRGRRRSFNSTTTARNGTPKPDANRKKTSPEEALDAPEQAFMDDGTPTRRKSRRGPPPAYGSEASLSGTQTSKTKGEFSDNKLERSKSRSRRKEITPKKPSQRFGRLSMSSPIAGSTRGQSQPPQACPLGTPSIENHILGTQAQQGDNRQIFQLEKDRQRIWRAVGGQEKSPQSIPELGETLAKQIADPTGEHTEYDSILESEGFSMVSISSLPSAGLHSVSPAEQNGGFPRGHEPRDQKHDAENTSTFSQAAHGYSDISSIEQDRLPFNFTTNSVHRVTDGWKTPADVTSPQLPSAPKAMVADPGSRLWDEYEDGSAKISRVVGAGTALHNALGSPDGGLQSTPASRGTDSTEHAKSENIPTPPASQMQRSIKTTPEQPIEDPFAGFSGGTRRELRAGLRLGQELAKKRLRQSTTSKLIADDKNNLASRTSENTNSQSSARKSEPERQDSYQTSVISYPILPDQQLPSPAHTASDDEDCMSWRANTPKQVAPLQPSPAPIPTGQVEDTQEASTLDRIMLAREAEWQREREAVSRQIEMANSSQVIVIDSDDSSIDLDQTDEQPQTYDSARKPKNTRSESNSLLEVEATGLERQELPNPGKQSMTALDKSALSSSESGLFWLPDSARVKATRRRHERRKRARDEDIAILSDTNDQSPPAAAWASQEPTSSILSRLVNSSAHDSSDTSDDDADMESPCKPAESSARHSPIPMQLADLNPPEDSRYSKDDTLHSHYDEDIPSTVDKDVRYPSIDPVLFEPQTIPSEQLVHKASVSSDTSVSDETSTFSKPASWLSALTKPLASLFCAPPPNSSPISSEPKPSLPPATQSDILSSSAPMPLSSHHPWTVPHFHALEPLYYAAHLYGAFIFPIDPYSPSARFLGTSIRTCTGWERKANEMDCGVTDAFMFLLSERSKGHDTTRRATRAATQPKATNTTAPASTEVGGGAKIDEEHVLRMCVRIWADMVQRGDVDLQRGEVAGMRRDGDRVWRTSDIQAADSRKAYFERKKKEWGGLPSWRRKGLVGM